MAKWYVYLIEEQEWNGLATGWVKIGASNNPGARIGGLTTGNPRHLELVYQHPVASRRIAFDAENNAHHRLKAQRQIGREWFLVDTELACSMIEWGVEEAIHSVTGSYSPECEARLAL